MEIPKYTRNVKSIETEFENSDHELARKLDIDYNYLKAWKEPPPIKHTPDIPKTKCIKVMFMQPPMDSGNRSRTQSCREYMAVDCQTYMLRQTFMHVELCFVESPYDGKNASFSSAADTDGVTFVYNKKYDPEFYKEIWDIQVTQSRYDRAYMVARDLVGKKYDYAFIWCFIFQHCLPQCTRKDRYTCSFIVATLLATIGIGDDAIRHRLTTDNNLMADDIYNIIRDAYNGVNNIPISNQIICIMKGKLPDSMNMRVTMATQYEKAIAEKKKMKEKADIERKLREMKFDTGFSLGVIPEYK